MATYMGSHPSFLPLQPPSVNTLCLLKEASTELSLLGHLGLMSVPEQGRVMN